MNKKEISQIVKKQANFSLFLATAPMLFLLIINYFAKNDNSLLIFLTPIITVVATAHFVKNVLIEVYEGKST